MPFLKGLLTSVVRAVANDPRVREKAKEVYEGEIKPKAKQIYEGEIKPRAKDAWEQAQPQIQEALEKAKPEVEAAGKRAMEGAGRLAAKVKQELGGSRDEGAEDTEGEGRPKE